MGTVATNPLILAMVCLYSVIVMYNIYHFHNSGFASTARSDFVYVKEQYMIKFDDELASKEPLHEKENESPEATITINESNGSKNTQEELKPDLHSYREERNIFKKMLERSSKDSETCSNLHPDHLGESKPKDFDTGVSPLPENGIHKVLKAWLDGGLNDRGDYPMCELPPAKSCDVSKYSLILMSHTVDDDKRLNKLRSAIKNFATRSETAEIILIWNSERKVLEESQKRFAKDLVQWSNDQSHPLRIFYSLENGLGNNLLNRYHPMVNPTQEAIMYFDDDGPFYNEEAMHAGFKLWKFNSDVQIGSLTRNIRYPSERMNDLQNKATDLAAEHYRKDTWQTHVHPYDEEAVNQAMKKNNIQEPGYPEFTPICRDETGDNLEYNYFVFPNYKAHMSLPSGSILHRNYLCFVWHPLFSEIRQFILDHPTHPDDMTISTLVSHLSGKPMRTFPRQWAKKKRRNLRDEVEIGNENEEFENNVSSSQNDNVGLSSSHGQERRKLLWQQKDWGNMREEAINSILGYFGSVNPGSVGWCAGSEYEKPATGRGNMRFNCVPEFPEGHMIPWMNEGGLGYDECPN